MIGVLGGNRGFGLGRLLIEEVLRVSASSNRSHAVCLTTESGINVPMYEHLGFAVVGEISIGALHSWTMQRLT